MNFIVNSKPSRNSKSYKTAAILFAISGFIFIIVNIISVVGGKIGVFLPIGIALVIMSIVFWQHSKKLASSEHKDSSK